MEKVHIMLIYSFACRVPRTCLYRVGFRKDISNVSEVEKRPWGEIKAGDVRGEGRVGDS